LNFSHIDILSILIVLHNLEVDNRLNKNKFNYKINDICFKFINHLYNLRNPKAVPFKPLLNTLLFLITVFIVSAFPLFLGFILKHMDPSEYGLIQEAKQDLEITFKEILFFTSIVLCLFLLSVANKYVKKKGLKIFIRTIALVYLTAAFLMILTDVVYYLIFACRITFSAVQTVLNTNPEEARGFIKLYSSPATILTILAFISLYIAIVIFRKRIAVLMNSTTFFITSAIISVFGIIDFGQIAHSKGNGPHNVRYWDIIIGEYNQYRQFNRDIEAEKNTHFRSGEYKDYYNKDTIIKTLVLVISESLSKNHMSLYGYPRKTTPHLDTLKKIYKFNNCVTNAALTIEAVPGLFFNGYLRKRINLISLANMLGYETTWISNQSGWGKGDKTIVLLSQLCNRSVFLDELADNDQANTSFHYDESVLRDFEQELKKDEKRSRLIVLHLMGCHYDYEKRYPVNRNYFKGTSPSRTAVKSALVENVINSYDNAMRYHDSVIYETIRIFSMNTHHKNAALVFLSDHGEELYENRNHAGHGYPPNRVTSEIPYFTMLSENFKKNYPEIELAMKQRKNTAYSLSNNFYTLTHMLHISSIKHEKKILRNSFFSPSYDSLAPRMVMGVDYNSMNP
jgi:heptose-I-phosphate ethanolaminephosphotransferase